MIPLPPLSFGLSSSASSKLDQYGNVWDMGGGARTINIGGSGFAAQSPTVTPWWIGFAAAAVLYLWLRSNK